MFSHPWELQQCEHNEVVRKTRIIIKTFSAPNFGGQILRWQSYQRCVSKDSLCEKKERQKTEIAGFAFERSSSAHTFHEAVCLFEGREMLVVGDIASIHSLKEFNMVIGLIRDTINQDLQEKDTEV